ncbi:BON domain-containing protein [Rubripirellula sp.]|nr:BON domain-containing protein [Rubripirellula sp.]MDF1844247.1 BON domain-containing protein [Rubripirellula sp.]
MMYRIVRIFGFLAISCCVGNVATAQSTGLDAGDIGSTTGENGQLDADTAFSAIDRGDTVGSTGSTGQGFSSASSATGATAGGGGLGGFGGLGGGGLGGFANLFGGIGGAGSQNTQPVIRTRLRSAISVAPMQPAMVQRAAVTRFRVLTTRPQLRGINVRMDGRTAIISGVVPTQRDRRMSEMLIRLEPGVSAVVNEISVAQ